MNAISFSAGELALYAGVILGSLGTVIGVLFKALLAAKDETIAQVCKECDEWRALNREHMQLSSRSIEVARTVTMP